MRMRISVNSPAFNMPLPGQMQEKDGKTGERRKFSLITAEDTAIRLALEESTSEEILKQHREEDEEAGDHLKEGWKNGDELNKYREENPQATQKEIVSSAQHDPREGRIRSDTTLTDDETMCMRSQEEDDLAAGEDETGGADNNIAAEEPNEGGAKVSEDKREAKDKGNKSQEKKDDEVQEDPMEVEDQLEVDVSEALVEDLIKDDPKDNTGENSTEGGARDMETVEERKEDEAGEGEEEEEEEEEEELPKIADTVGGSSEPEIVGERGGIEVISKDPHYDMYKCSRCIKVFKTERDMSKHYRSDHTRVENRVMLAEVKLEGNYRAVRIKVMEEAREENMTNGRKELKEREEELARTRRCEVEVKKIKVATGQKGGLKRTPQKAKKRRATESSTDEEKTPKTRNKKLKGEETQKQETPKPRQASAANPDNRSQGRMPMENVNDHVERAVETVKAVGAWMEATRGRYG